MGNNEEAIGKYRQVVGQEPGFAEAWYDWGLALKKLGKRDEALEKKARSRQLGYLPPEEVY